MAPPFLSSPMKSLAYFKFLPSEPLGHFFFRRLPYTVFFQYRGSGRLPAICALPFFFVLLRSAFTDHPFDGFCPDPTLFLFLDILFTGEKDLCNSVPSVLFFSPSNYFRSVPWAQPSIDFPS